MKMHWCTTLFALAAPVFSLPLAAPRSTVSSERAIWFWNTDIILDDSQVETFIKKMTDKEHPFQTVLALADRGMGNAPWQSFIKKCSAAGLKVEALFGDAQWIVGRVEEDGKPLDYELNWIKQYQASAPTDAKFSGIHLDVEPWSLDGWESNKKEYVSSLVEIVSKTKQTAKALNLPLGADLPFWANTVPCKNANLDTCLVDNLDYLTFMTYRNTANSLLGIADPVLDAVKAKDSSKPVWLSVETSSTASDVGLISYAVKSLNTLFNDLVKVETKATASSSSFAGIAVHDYTHLVNMGV